MINDNDVVRVTNRDNWTIGYQIPELNNLTRRFGPNESKMLTALELRRLAWLPGGRALISNHLIVEDRELTRELISDVEPEYYYTREDVKDLLLHGSEDQLRDALDFGPDGVVSLIKDLAVDMKLNDVRKREIIREATNFDVSGAIRINEESEVKVEETKARRAAPITEAQVEDAVAAPARRAATPRYKVTTTENK